MLKPLPPSNWSTPQAAHLLNRAGFGGTPEEIQALQALGLEKAVDRLISGEEDDDLFPPPEITQPAQIFENSRTLRAAATEAERREMKNAHRQEQGRQIRATRAWWLNRMRYTPFPLREKMTLFWHGHFATGFEKSNLTFLMWQQNETFRANALGNFRVLTKQVSKDPAMMRYLDTSKNEKTKPNENFARELMELFLLGEGVRYTEKDIQESARAFTGYRITPRTQQFSFERRRFDDSEKTFMGRKGAFHGDDIVDIILEQPESSEYIVSKLWRFFASDDPHPSLVTALGAHFRNSGYDIASTMREIFLSEEFYSPKVIRSQVKSPVQWVVQTARVLESPLPDLTSLETVLPQLGQKLFEPPNVKGWEGGRTWISSSTLLLRYNLAGYIVSGKAPALDGFRRAAGSIDVPLDTVVPLEVRSNPEKLCDHVANRLFNAPVQGRERAQFLAFLEERGPNIDEPTLRDFLHLMMSTPEYQLT